MLDLGRGILLMNSQDKLLYHQTHPIKLIVDVGGTPPALYLLRQHQLRAGLVLRLAPAPLLSALLIRYADLNPYQRSALGKFMHTYKRPLMQAQRMATPDQPDPIRVPYRPDGLGTRPALA